jgi:steroid delta-isomerase
MTKESVQEAVERYYAALSARDLEAWLACFSEDVVSHSPVGAPVIEGRDGMRLALKLVANTLREIHIAPDDVYVCGSSAAVKWSARGTGHDGRPVSFAGINVFEVDLEGRIRRIHAYWDPNAMIRQINP